MAETQSCENCGVEVGEEAKRGFTFYKGLRLCLSCYETLQPHPIVKVDEVRIPSVRLSSKFDDETASQFSESIAEHGILIPIHIFKDESGNFWLADGLHRLNQLKSMRRKFAPAVVKEGSEVDAAVASVRLNMLRGRANLAELAKLITYLRDTLGWTLQKICREIGLRSEGYVSTLYRLAKTRPDLMKAVEEERLSIHAAIEQLRGSTAKERDEQMESDRGGVATPSTVEAQQAKPQPKKQENSKGGLAYEDLAALEETAKEQEGSPVKKREFMTCDFCGKLLSRKEVAWIKVHNREYDEVLMRIKGEVRDERGAEA